MSFPRLRGLRQRPFWSRATLLYAGKKPGLQNEAAVHTQMKAMILQPYDPAEAINITMAASRAGKSDRTIRNWCLDRHIGRRIGGRWAVSAVALDMLLAGDESSLQAYLAGDRSSARVVSYYIARSIPRPSLLGTFTAEVSGSSDFAAVETADT
jgi:hypothetical protein